MKETLTLAVAQVWVVEDSLRSPGLALGLAMFGLAMFELAGMVWMVEPAMAEVVLAPPVAARVIGMIWVKV
jgi:hypothetical protein